MEWTASETETEYGDKNSLFLNSMLMQINDTWSKNKRTFFSIFFQKLFQILSFKWVAYELYLFNSLNNCSFTTHFRVLNFDKLFRVVCYLNCHFYTLFLSFCDKINNQFCLMLETSTRVCFIDTLILVQKVSRSAKVTPAVLLRSLEKKNIDCSESQYHLRDSWKMGNI